MRNHTAPLAAPPGESRRGLQQRAQQQPIGTLALQVAQALREAAAGAAQLPGRAGSTPPCPPGWYRVHPAAPPLAEAEAEIETEAEAGPDYLAETEAASQPGFPPAPAAQRHQQVAAGQDRHSTAG